MYAKYYFKSDNDFFQILYLESFGESTGDIYNIKENTSFLSMSNIMTPDDVGAGVHTAIINKITLDYLNSYVSLDNIDFPTPQYEIHRVGKCQVMH